MTSMSMPDRTSPDRPDVPPACVPSPGVPDDHAPLVVVMGVSGSGKSTVGPAVAAALGVPFVDADDFHDDVSIARMRRGEPLDDAARGPWLDRLHAQLLDHRATGAVLACSALTPAYRAQLADGIDAVFVLLDVPAVELDRRLRHRRGHFAGAALLPSQLTTLEAGPGVHRVDGDRAPAAVAAAAVAVVRSTE
jgi:gluconokinase